ncbi:MAG TPA: HEAT repeat domain-containing protein [Planctomycetota bacterium]|nr:HEAT repeat domain-containing protein [Planctomycetota bacterium]
MHHHRPSPLRLVPGLLCVVSSVLAQTPAGADPSADLRSRSIDTRLAAIDAIGASKRADADRLLLPLLNDKDWEIQERTATALGKAAAKSAQKQLIDLSLDGDVVRVRQAAAQALAAIDAVEAGANILKRAKGKNQVAALEALALTNRHQPALPGADKLEKLLRDKDAAVREAAAVAWLECHTDRAGALKTLLSEPFLVVRCRALDAVAAAPRADDLEPLRQVLGGGGQNEVVERRLLRALAAVLDAATDDRPGLAKAVLEGAGTETLAMTRRARLCVLLCRGDKPVFDKKTAVAAVQASLVARDGTARAAAAKALREIGGDEALAAALAHFPRETDRRAQLQLVDTVVALRPLTTPAAVDWLLNVVGKDLDEGVRERAIVLLGRSGIQGAADVLIGALADRSWTIACCAAVSLGKTDDDKAFAPLQKLLGDKDWTLRGAAVVGLMHWNREAVVEPLIGMLTDTHPVVARAAHAALSTIADKYDVAAEPKAWRAWWTQNQGKHVFTDHAASIDKLKKYGYAVPDTEIYQGLDVIVFKSRGDHIEQLLEHLEIAHRETEQKLVPESGVYPEAIFVANCTGELAPGDVQPIEWFVRTGGSLFGSCWALTETIARIHPGVVQKAPTSERDVIDDVRAMPCSQSPLLTGVFPPGVVPIYHLEGAHLIQVLDPEACEVLIDSPDAAERHGTGNLAAWFFSGHGVILDSVNHFDMQGLPQDLKTAPDRQAYAVDHLGMSFEKWRASRTEAYWKLAPKASKSVPDLSAFRLITNFVRSKRLGEY